MQILLAKNEENKYGFWEIKTIKRSTFSAENVGVLVVALIAVICKQSDAN